ncbi:hypothetical protein NE237_002509 [Protea cynaroides]|uniref:GDSL esterase/lipase n=1 Tax=Protea cynaroides TaxID=273540 RepID=A0A9Q0KV69_9MAGN|nr:hypothetical protein NE237_002509 [Protea cynaroides]
MLSAAAFSLLLIFLLIVTVPIRARPPAIIVLGDSTVDSGNNNQIRTVLKSNHHPYGRDFLGGQPTGRFSNGRLPPDFISEAMGIKPLVPAYLDPQFTIKDFATGVCFASAGTGYDNATSDVLNVIPLWKEIENYKAYQSRLREFLGVEMANQILSEALYLISIGTNDFLENYFVLPVRSSKFTVRQYQDFLIGIAENFLKELYELGARKISLGGLPPMGCLPLERTTNAIAGGGCIQKYNVVAKNFNVKLQGLVLRLQKELPEIQLVFSNPYDFVLQIIRNPTLFGFENAAVACCGTGLFELGYLCDEHNPFTCMDANKYKRKIELWSSITRYEEALQEREVLAYLISCTDNSSDGSRNGQKSKTVAGSGSGGDHPASFNCNCFRCYMSYWVRWDSSPNRQIIHEILDGFEDQLIQQRANSKSKRERRRRGGHGHGCTNDVNRFEESSVVRHEMDELEAVEVSGGEICGGGDGGCGGEEKVEKGSMRRFVSFIGERIWGVWS